MTSQRAAAIQSATAKANGGFVAKKSFAAIAQKAAAKHINAGLVKPKKK